MPRTHRPYRVALTSPYRWQRISESFHGVIEFKQQVPHWQLVAQGHDPIEPFAELDLAAVDGVIGYLSDPEWAEALQRAGVPAVNLSTAYEGIPLPVVANDDHAIGRMGGEHLTQRGFAHFGFIGQAAFWFSHRRFNGFREVIESAAGRSCHELWIESDERSDIIPQTRAWIEGLPRPIALMTANDILGRHAIDAAVALGLRVPEDVAVLGVDNDRWYTQMAAVPLSSVEPDARRMGYVAAKLLDGLMAGGAPPPPQWIAPVGVVTRRSTDITLADDPIAAKALGYIHDHCGDGIGITDVLDALNISRRSLEMHLKDAVGQSPRAVIFQAQIERAKKMLMDGNESTYNIARACGFSRQDRFFIVFRRLVGMTPGEYRRRYGVQHA